MGSVGMSICTGRSVWGAYEVGELKEGCPCLQLAGVKVSAPRQELCTVHCAPPVGSIPEDIQVRAD